MTLFTVLNGNS